MQTLSDHCVEPEALPKATADVIAINSSTQRRASQASRLQPQQTKRVPRGGVAIDMLRAEQAANYDL